MLKLKIDGRKTDQTGSVLFRIDMSFIRDGIKEIGWMLGGMVLAALFGALLVIGYQGRIPFFHEEKWLTCLCQDASGRQVELKVMYPSYPAGPIRLQLPDGSTRELPMVKAKKGARYSDGLITFWDLVSRAQIEEGEQIIYRDCTILE